MKLTRIGGPTVLVEFDGWRILLDPTFDAPGRRYTFGWGTASTKTLAPALAVEELGPIDLALVSHDHHADNLDDAGRALLPSVGAVITTASGAGRMSRQMPLPNLHGLRAGERVVLPSGEAGRPGLEITATPCRHGPPLLHRIVGDVIGFAIRRAGEARVSLWVTGDTVPFSALRRAAAEMEVDVAVVNVGGVRFGITGPLRYTLNGREAVELIDVAGPRVVAFAHYDGWSHFRDGEHGLRRALDGAAASVRERARWLTDGVAVEV
jgi:L-ascorbate metabolism protein UlaG (beta-lactamase superfamily)